MTRSLMLAAVALPAAAPSAVLRSAAALSAAGVSPALVTASAAGAFSSAGGVDASGALQPAKRKGMAVAVQHSFFILSSLVGDHAKPTLECRQCSLEWVKEETWPALAARSEEGRGGKKW